MKFVIKSDTATNIDELEKLYDDLNNYLSATTNYPGWIKSTCPIREDAVADIKNNTLFVVRYDGKMTDSAILNHHPDGTYNNTGWKVEADYSHTFVIHTFVVHLSFLKMGIGRVLMDCSFESIQQSGIKSTRLDIYENSLPGISLYEKCSFGHINTVDLSFDNCELDWFKLYEKPA